MGLLNNRQPRRMAIFLFIVAGLLAIYGVQFVWQEYSAWQLKKQLSQHQLVTQGTIERTHNVTDGRGRVIQQEISYRFAPLHSPVIHVQNYDIKDTNVHPEATFEVVYLPNQPRRNMPLYDLQVANSYDWIIHAIDLAVGEALIMAMGLYNWHKFRTMSAAAQNLP